MSALRPAARGGWRAPGSRSSPTPRPAARAPPTATPCSSGTRPRRRWVAAARAATRWTLRRDSAETPVVPLAPADPVPLRDAPSLIELTLREGAALGLSSARDRRARRGQPRRARASASSPPAARGPRGDAGPPAARPAVRLPPGPAPHLPPLRRDAGARLRSTSSPAPSRPTSARAAASTPSSPPGPPTSSSARSGSSSSSTLETS